MKNDPIKIYFASDFHLGTPNNEKSFKREEIIIKWLNEVSADATEIVLLGDLFDFWVEYKTVIPKGFSRLMGALSAISDKGIKLHIFTGNHDLWQWDYFSREMNAILYKKPVKIDFGDKKFYLAHGDGLGPGDYSYKFLKLFFYSPFCQWLFRWIHPDIGLAFGSYCSRKSRLSEDKHADTFLGENEWLVNHSRKILSTDYDIDYLVYGHRHYPVVYALNDRSRYVNLGDMISHFSYAVFDGSDLTLHSIKS